MVVKISNSIVLKNEKPPAQQVTSENKVSKNILYTTDFRWKKFHLSMYFVKVWF